MEYWLLILIILLVLLIFPLLPKESMVPATHPVHMYIAPHYEIPSISRQLSPEDIEMMARIKQLKARIGLNG